MRNVREYLDGIKGILVHPFFNGNRKAHEELITVTVSSISKCIIFCTSVTVLTLMLHDSQGEIIPKNAMLRVGSVSHRKVFALNT